MTPPPFRLGYCISAVTIVDGEAELPYHFMLAQQVSYEGKRLRFVELDNVSYGKTNPLLKDEESFWIGPGKIFFTKLNGVLHIQYVDVRTYVIYGLGVKYYQQYLFK